jgi:hypothetical protein
MLRVLGWVLTIVVGLVVALTAWTLYAVYSFDTETLPARHGQFDLAFYPHAEPGKPLIVTFGGAEGGNMWDSARWRGQRERFGAMGFGVLTVGYFGTPTTPARLDRIDLGALHRLIREHMDRPNVQSRCLILIGGSKGSELSLTLASHFTDVDAVVALSPGDTVFPAHTDAMTTSSWSIDGKPLPFAPMPWAATWDLIRGDIGAVMTRVLAQPEAAAARIPTENAAARMLLIASDRDEMWPSLMMARRIEARATSGQVKVLAVPGDHRAVVEHMDRVEDFLKTDVAQLAKCGS